MKNTGSGTDGVQCTHDEDHEVSRRRLLRTTAFGTAGVGAATGSFLVAGEEQYHDHSGDRLGVDDPVASIRAEEVTVRDLEFRSVHLVYEDGGTWYALDTAEQDVAYSGPDGGAVVNDALSDSGDVRVLAGAGGTTLETGTTIRHTRSDTSLVLEPGLVFEFTGRGTAVERAGNRNRFVFDVIDANGADYCIRTTGLGPGSTVGTTLRGAADSLWFVDSEDGSPLGAAGQYVDVREFDCTAHPTPYGFRSTIFYPQKTEGYWFDVGAIRGPTDAGIKMGEPDDGEPGDEQRNERTVGFFLFDAFVDGETNQARRLVEMNDSYNGVVLRGYTPATGGDWDVEVDEKVRGFTLTAVAGRGELRVKREAVLTTDLSKFDPFGGEIIRYDLQPDALEGYETTVDGGSVVADADGGHVEHRTGPGPESHATVTRRAPLADLSFDHPAALETTMTVPSGTVQEAWLVWGRPEGPAVGWHVLDDLLEGYVHDGEAVSTVPLRTGVQPDDSWTVAAFYTPPTDVYFYLADRKTVTVEALATGGTGASVTADGTNVLQDGNPPGETGGDVRLAGSVATNLPVGRTAADRVLTAKLANASPGRASLRWSYWTHHHYPNGGDHP
jgi:hypothetical protein